MNYAMIRVIVSCSTISRQSQPKGCARGCLGLTRWSSWRLRHFLPGFWLRAPGLNRAYPSIFSTIEADPALVRLDGLPLEGASPSDDLRPAR